MTHPGAAASSPDAVKGTLGTAGRACDQEGVLLGAGEGALQSVVHVLGYALRLIKNQENARLGVESFDAVRFGSRKPHSRPLFAVAFDEHAVGEHLHRELDLGSP